MSDIILSPTEQILFDFILENSEIDITIKVIEEKLGTKFVGALGKLVCLKIIICEKKNIELEVINKNKYGYIFGHKWTKCFFIKEENL